MKKLINQLVEASYTHNELDEKTVEEIAGKLSLKELKLYIRALKLAEKKRTVYVEIPHSKTKPNPKTLEEIFGKKTIRFIENPDLIVGMRVIDNDTVYNMNLKNTLERMVDYVTE